jgi:hypothetical protein
VAGLGITEYEPAGMRRSGCARACDDEHVGS